MLSIWPLKSISMHFLEEGNISVYCEKSHCPLMYNFFSSFLFVRGLYKTNEMAQQNLYFMVTHMVEAVSLILIF